MAGKRTRREVRAWKALQKQARQALNPTPKKPLERPEPKNGVPWQPGQVWRPSQASQPLQRYGRGVASGLPVGEALDPNLAQNQMVVGQSLPNGQPWTVQGLRSYVPNLQSAIDVRQALRQLVRLNEERNPRGQNVLVVRWQRSLVSLPEIYSMATVAAFARYGATAPDPTSEPAAFALLSQATQVSRGLNPSLGFVDRGELRALVEVLADELQDPFPWSTGSDRQINT